MAVPDDGGLALVGDADGGEIAGHEAALLERVGDDFAGAAPDLIGVVLHPAGLRKDLFVFLLGDGDDAAGAVEDDESRAGRALVDGADVVGHVSPLRMTTFHDTTTAAGGPFQFGGVRGRVLFPMRSAALSELATASAAATHSTVR